MTTETATSINQISALELDRPQSLKKLTTLVYALQAASFILGITSIIAVIINYVKRSDVRDTSLESHFRWQIRTFWFALLWFVIGVVSALFIVGYLVLFANMIWIIYRIVKGWLNLNEGKEMYLRHSTVNQR